MGRDYSKRGCVSCKRRRKKCDEKKPSCTACVRHHIQCTYDELNPARSKGQTPVVVGPLEFDPLTWPISSLQAITFRNETEHQILCRVPRSVLQFYSPTSRYKAEDLQILWQMMFQDELVRNALVACWSVILGRDGRQGELERTAYGRALQLLQLRISRGQFDYADFLSASVAILFVGLLESLGPEAYTDTLQHCKALVLLAVEKGMKLSFDWQAMPQNLSTLLLEGILFHLACLGMFSKDMITLEHLWKQAKLDKALDQVNPIGPKRPSNSTFLSGQYTAFHMMMTVTRLHRTHGSGLVPTLNLDRMEATISDLENRLYNDLESVMRGRHAREDVRNFCTVYWITFKGLRIGVDTLRAPTRRTKQKVEDLVSVVIQSTRNLPLLPVTLDGLAWALQITACAASRIEDLESLGACFERLKPHLDPGHISRADGLLIELRELIGSQERENRDSDRQPDLKVEFPVGLALLQRPDGVFS